MQGLQTETSCSCLITNARNHLNPNVDAQVLNRKNSYTQYLPVLPPVKKIKQRSNRLSQLMSVLQLSQIKSINEKSSHLTGFKLNQCSEIAAFILQLDLMSKTNL